VLVTGASGLVGSWLVKDLLRLEASVAVLVMDSDPQSELFRSGDVLRTTVFNGRLQDFSEVERAVGVSEADTVFHLAAQTLVGPARRAPLHTFESNIRGTYHVLEACRRHGEQVRRLVVASSDKAYGDQPTLPYAESMPLLGRHPYDVSKACADLLAQGYHRSYGLPVAVARCGNIYGGGDLNWSRIVPGTIRSLLHGERPVLRSDGSFVRDYIYVRDIVHAYLTLAEQMEERGVAGEGFNFGHTKPLTVLQLCTIIGRLMKRAALRPDIRGSAQGEIHSQYLSCEKASRSLGWRPRYGLEAGLKETIAWYRGYLSGRGAARGSSRAL